MGSAKNWALEQEGYRAEAVQVGLATGLFRECRHETPMVNDKSQLDFTYALANKRITKGILVADRRRMTDTILFQAGYLSDSCSMCDKQAAE